MINFLDFIKESSDRHQSLDRAVFDFDVSDEPKIKPPIRQQILIDASTIEDITPLNGVYVVGNILTNNYGVDTPIDVAILVGTENMDDVSHVRAIRALKNISDRLARETRHPINYFIIEGDNDKPVLRRYESVYSLHSDEWLKRATTASMKLRTFMRRIDSNLSVLGIDDIEDSSPLIAVSDIKSFTKPDLKKLKTLLQSRVYELDELARKSVHNTSELSSLRKTAFDDTPDPKKLASMLSRGTLPNDTISELLRKFRCKEAIATINSIIGDSASPAIQPPAIAKVQESSDEPIDSPFTYRELEEFMETYRLCESLATLRVPTRLSDYSKRQNDTTDHRAHTAKHNSQKTRGFNRKRLGQTDQYTHVRIGAKTGSPLAVPNMFNATNLITKAKNKKVPTGRWMINPGQARWIASKYHFNMPNNNDPIKHLSNTPIVLYRSKQGRFFLVKHPMLKPRAGGF